MQKISTFNKCFLVLCAIIIVFLAMTVPHEKESHQSSPQQNEENN